MPSTSPMKYLLSFLASVFLLACAETDTADPDAPEGGEDTRRARPPAYTTSRLPDLPPAAAAAVAQLESDIPRERILAARTLAAMGPKATPALAHLVKILPDHSFALVGDDTTTPGREAALAVRRITGSIEAVVKHLEHPNHRARANVAAALGRIGDPAALGPLAGALGDDRWKVVQAAAGALCRFGARAVPFLKEALGSEDDAVRANAAYTVGAMGDPALADMLDPLLDDPAPAVKLQASRARARLAGAPAPRP